MDSYRVRVVGLQQSSVLAWDESFTADQRPEGDNWVRRGSCQFIFHPSAIIVFPSADIKGLIELLRYCSLVVYQSEWCKGHEAK